MVIPMDAPTQAEMVWFGILMLILIGLTHLHERYKNRA